MKESCVEYFKQNYKFLPEICSFMILHSVGLHLIIVVICQLKNELPEILIQMVYF